MSGDTDTDDPIRTETDGLTVEKRFDPQEEGVVHVEFTLTADGEQALHCRLVETIPPEFPDGSVGLHPEHGRDCWSVEGRSLVYEDAVEPGQRVRTLYAVRRDRSDIDALRTPPVVEAIPATETTGGGDDTDADDPFRDLPAEGADGSTAAATAGGPTVDPDARGRDEEPRTTAETDGAGKSWDGDAETSDTDAESGSGDGEVETRVVDALLEELRSADLSTEERTLLREALGVTSDQSNRGSLEARVRHVQNTVDDLEAYRDALEDLIAGHGTDEHVIDAFENDIAALEAAVGDLEASVSELDERVSGLPDRDRIEGIEDRTAAVEERVAELDALSETVAAHEDAIADAREAIETGQAWRRQVDEATAIPATTGVEDATDAEGGSDVPAE
jgi:hypothetical protein